jgi:hypothetical protein
MVTRRLRAETSSDTDQTPISPSRTPISPITHTDQPSAVAGGAGALVVSSIAL